MIDQKLESSGKIGVLPGLTRTVMKGGIDSFLNMACLHKTVQENLVHHFTITLCDRHIYRFFVGYLHTGCFTYNSIMAFVKTAQRSRCHRLPFHPNYHQCRTLQY